MFTLQSGQIENALRGAGVPDISAKEMMQGVANCAAPVEHRGAMALTKPSVNYFPTIRPSGPSLKFTQDNRTAFNVTNTLINIPPWQNVPFTPLPYLPIPPWETIPYPGWAPNQYVDNSLTVQGPVNTGPITTNQGNITNVNTNVLKVTPPGGAGGSGTSGPGSGGVTGGPGAGGANGGSGPGGGNGRSGSDGRDGAPGSVPPQIINEGDIYNYGDTVNEGDTFIGGSQTIQNNLTVNGQVYNNNTVTNKAETYNNVVHNQFTHNHGPTWHYAETHWKGPNYINGPNFHRGPNYFVGNTYVNGRPLNLFNVDVITDVSWDGTTLSQTKKTLRIFGRAGDETTETVLDCSV